MKRRQELESGVALIAPAEPEEVEVAPKVYGDQFPPDPHAGGKFAPVPATPTPSRKRGAPQQARAPPVLAYTQQELAAAAKISLAHFFALCRIGRGPRHAALGRRKVILVADAQAWLESQVVQNSETPEVA
jgi:hypothetical protein